MKKILFVYPGEMSFLSKNKRFNDFLFKFLITKSSTFHILSAITPKRYHVRIVDIDDINIKYDEKYDLVGITCNTSYANKSYKIADEFRREGAKVVLGGWHPSALPNEAKQHADAVVVGEAEETWPQLLKDFENGKLKPFYIPTRPVDQKLIPMLKNVDFKKIKIALQATRGCPFNCDFCAVSSVKYRNVFRKRPVEDVIEELKFFPQKIFSFFDDSLTIDTNYTKDLFRKMKGLNKKFRAFGNINVLGNDEELLKLAREAGCMSWLIGFESVCQESLNSVNKANKVKDYRKSIKKIHDYGSNIEGYFVFGFDYDTIDIFDKTDEFVRKAEIDIIHPVILTPIPGTVLFNRLKEEKRILTENWDYYNQQFVVFQPKNMSPEELKINTEIFKNRIYKTSAVIKRVLRSIDYGYYPFINTASQNTYWKFSGKK